MPIEGSYPSREVDELPYQFLCIPRRPATHQHETFKLIVAIGLDANCIDIKDDVQEMVMILNGKKHSALHIHTHISS